MKEVGIGIVGLGYIGKVHLRQCLRLSNARLVAVSDVSKKALNLARDMGVKKVYKNCEQFFDDPELDSVIIALPTHLHLEFVKKAAEAKKHIFLEKPIARNVEEAKEIISVAQKNSVKLMMGYPMRFNPVYLSLRDQIQSGSLGDIEIAYATNISTGPFFHRILSHAPVPVPDWWFSKELTGGGALIDLGSHMINLLRWYFGEIIDIKSHLNYRFNLDVEDSANCVAKFETGTIANISVGWFSQEHKSKVEVFGSVKHSVAENPHSNMILTMLELLLTGNSKSSVSFFSELQYFVNCLIDDLQPSPSAEDGLRDIEAISLAYKNTIGLG